MILAFRFVNQTENGVLENILKRALEAWGCHGRVVRKEDETVLYIEEENTEELERFADSLAMVVPHSIFLKSYSVEAVESIPDDTPWEKPACRPRAMPPCPQCLSEVRNPKSGAYGNVFHHCDVCGYPVAPSALILRNFAKVTKVEADGNHIELFETLAKVLKNGGKATLQTMNGLVTVAALTEKNVKSFPIDEIVFPDVHTASRFFEMQKGEVLALGSIEKPRIRLLTSPEFKEAFPFVEKSFFHIKLPDDMVLYFLLEALARHEGSICYLSGTVDTSAKISLSFEEVYTVGELPLEAVVTEEGDALVSGGERGILPWCTKGFGKKRISVCGEYVGLMEDTSIMVDHESSFAGRDLEADSLLIAEGEDAPEASLPIVRYAHRHGAFFSVLGEHGLLEKKTAGIYISKTHECAIMIHGEKFGLVDFVRFDFGYSSFGDVFSAIRAMNETGEKLLENFGKKFPEQYGGVEKEKIASSGSDVMTLFGVVGVLLGFGRTIAEASRRLLDNAAAFKGKKGPRIDYKLKEDRKLDPLWCIRTAMSFRLAGVDDLTLSFGVIESFSEFLSTMIDDIQTDMGLDGVVMCGSLFEEKKILQKTHLLVSKNHAVYYNKALPPDDINTVYGALLLAL